MLIRDPRRAARRRAAGRGPAAHSRLPGAQLGRRGHLPVLGAVHLPDHRRPGSARRARPARPGGPAGPSRSASPARRPGRSRRPPGNAPSDAVLGRVSAVFFSGVAFATLIGAVVGPAVAQAAGLTTLAALACAVTTAAAILALALLPPLAGAATRPAQPHTIRAVTPKPPPRPDHGRQLRTTLPFPSAAARKAGTGRHRGPGTTGSEPAVPAGASWASAPRRTAPFDPATEAPPIRGRGAARSLASTAPAPARHDPGTVNLDKPDPNGKHGHATEHKSATGERAAPNNRTPKPRPETQTPEPRSEAQTPDPETRTPKPRPEAQTPDPETGPRNPDPGPRNRTPKPRPEAGPRTPKPDPGPRSRSPGPQSPTGTVRPTGPRDRAGSGLHRGTGPDPSGPGSEPAGLRARLMLDLAKPAGPRPRSCRFAADHDPGVSPGRCEAGRAERPVVKGGLATGGRPQADGHRRTVRGGAGR
jgi:hypothetical protein